MPTRLFTLDDASAFARLSGDYNPLHLDPVMARRLLFGKPVVHGVNVLLWALDIWLEDIETPVTLKSIRASYPAPVSVGEKVSVSVEDAESGIVKLFVQTARSSAVFCQVSYALQSDGHEIEIRSHDPDTKEPLELSLDDLSEASGEIEPAFDAAHAEALYPNICRAIPGSQIAVLLSTTRIVGMYCPGLHSVFSKVDLSFVAPSEDRKLNYRVARIDRLLSRVEIELSGAGVSGILSCFLRRQPRSQIDFKDMQNLIEQNRFKGQRALIVGGSRGLGEVTAKALAAGGARVSITCNVGTEDAERVVDEITAGGGEAECFQLDVSRNELNIPDEATGEQLTHVYYFATPAIQRTEKGKFDNDTFLNYCGLYVHGFYKLVTTLASVQRLPIKYFYPSTVAIDELTPDLVEYILSKSAGETLCSYLNKTMSQVSISSFRLPKLSTDQLPSFLPTPEPGPETVLLELLQEFCEEDS